LGWDAQNPGFSAMVIAFAENKEDLFFFQTKEPTLKLSELKEIIGDELLSKDFNSRFK
jgi:hypothetical protein